MKKFSTYLASALLTLVVFTSCSSDPAEIDVAQLEEPCDYLDAMEAVVDEVLAIQKSVNGDPSKLTEDDLKRGQALSEKMEELGMAAYEKFGDEEPDCPNNLALQNKMMELR